MALEINTASVALLSCPMETVLMTVKLMTMKLMVNFTIEAHSMTGHSLAAGVQGQACGHVKHLGTKKEGLPRQAS